MKKVRDRIDRAADRIAPITSPSSSKGRQAAEIQLRADLNSFGGVKGAEYGVKTTITSDGAAVREREEKILEERKKRSRSRSRSIIGRGRSGTGGFSRPGSQGNDGRFDANEGGEEVPPLPNIGDLSLRGRNDGDHPHNRSRQPHTEHCVSPHRKARSASRSPDSKYRDSLVKKARDLEADAEGERRRLLRDIKDALQKAPMKAVESAAVLHERIGEEDLQKLWNRLEKSVRRQGKVFDLGGEEMGFILYD